MNPLHGHIKHVVIAVICVVGALFLLRGWKDMSVDLAKIEEETKVKVAQAAKEAAVAQQTKETAQKTIVVNDAATQAKVADLQRQLDKKIDSSQARNIIESALPGVKTVQATDASGKSVLAVEDTQENRDAINRKDVAFKTCQFSLSNCEANTLQYKAALEASDTIIAKKQEIITSQEQEIKKLKTFGKGGNFWRRTGRVVIPLACAGAGAYLGANNSTKGAAIGALAGGGACALTVRF